MDLAYRAWCPVCWDEAAEKYRTSPEAVSALSPWPLRTGARQRAVVRHLGARASRLLQRVAQNLDDRRPDLAERNPRLWEDFEAAVIALGWHSEERLVQGAALRRRLMEAVSGR